MPIKQKLRKFIISRPALQETIKGVIQVLMSSGPALDKNSNPYEDIKFASKNNYICIEQISVLFCNSAYSFTTSFKRQMYKITINLCYWAHNVKKSNF